MFWYNPNILPNQACRTLNRQATLKRVAGRSEVGAFGLELITRRSLVRIQAPLLDNTVGRRPTVFLLVWFRLAVAAAVIRRTSGQSRISIPGTLEATSFPHAAR